MAVAPLLRALGCAGSEVAGFVGLTQPILDLVLFGPRLTRVRGGGLCGSASWRILVPGLLMRLGISARALPASGSSGSCARG